MADKGLSYDDIKKQCLKDGILFEDPRFQAENSSLFYSKTPPRPFVWKRPKEICPDPKFFLGGASRLDVNQGMLRNSWLVSAFSSLAAYKSMLLKVAPEQSFSSSDYVGLFKFNIWNQGHWEEIVVDDRLPTYNGKLVFVHCEETNEFWAPLLEKAFAKIHGSYEALQRGSIRESFENFTGGVAESFDLKRPPTDLFLIMAQCVRRNGLIGCSIDTKPLETETQLGNGLVKGIAYSLDSVKRVPLRGGNREVRLVRVRCPWGNEREWNGAWSDKSAEWGLLTDAEKREMGLSFEGDGDFWMCFEDFLANFTRVDLCMYGLLDLTPRDSKNDSDFSSASHQSGWVKGTSAGGCRNFPHSFHTNPQFRMTLSATGSDDMCDVIIALMQKNRRSKRKYGEKMHSIGFAIYKLDAEDVNAEILEKDYFLYHSSEARSPTFTNDKEVVGRFTLAPGTYCIVPSTFNPGEEADFLLRIFTEKKMETVRMDDTTRYTPPTRPETHSPMDAKFYAFFMKVAGPDSVIDAFELQTILDSTAKGRSFSLETCRRLVAANNTEVKGKLNFEEFKETWKGFKEYMKVFAEKDIDKSGDMDVFELRNALSKLGFRLSQTCLDSLTSRFAGRKGRISFDDFISIAVRMETMFKTYLDWQKPGAGFTLDDFITSTICL